MASVYTSITLGAFPLHFRDLIIALQLSAFFLQNLALNNKNNRVSVSGPMCDTLPRKFYVQTSYKPSNYVFDLIFVDIKFPRVTYHTIVPSTEESQWSSVNT